MTTRILVVDMLSGRLPGEWVAGVIVLNAHRVTPLLLLSGSLHAAASRNVA